MSEQLRSSGTAPAARFRMLDERPFYWGFETSVIPVEIENLDLDVLADPQQVRKLRGVVDLHGRDGRYLRRLTEQEIPGHVPVGGKSRFEVGVDVRAFAGDYRLEFGLLEDGATHPTQAVETDIQVKNTLFDAFVELVNACNFRCTFCPQTTLQRPQRPMDFGLATKVVHELAEMGHHYPIRVHLLGEPLLYKRFFDFVDMAHAVDQRVMLATNGSRFSAENIAGILRTGLDEMVISLNTPEKHLYDAQRGTDLSFDDYLKGIEQMVRALVENGMSTKTRINVLYDAEKYDDPEQLRKSREVANQWIDVVREASGCDLAPAEESLHLDPSGTVLVPLIDRLELQFNAYHSWAAGGGNDKPFCAFPFRQLAVLVDGQTTACCVDAEGDINLGSALEMSVEEIWNGPELEHMRHSFYNQAAPHAICAGCKVRHDRSEYFPSEHSRYPHRAAAD